MDLSASVSGSSTAIFESSWELVVPNISLDSEFEQARHMMDVVILLPPFECVLHPGIIRNIFEELDNELEKLAVLESPILYGPLLLRGNHMSSLSVHFRLGSEFADYDSVQHISLPEQWRMQSCAP